MIHTVGSKYRFDANHVELLESCYKNSLMLADNYKCEFIAFPSIATGIYAYPKDKAAKIAYAIINKLLVNTKYIKDVIFVFYFQENANIFKKSNHIK